MITRSKSRQHTSATMACSAHFESILPKFTGYDAEDPELWLDRYERYALQKTWTTAQLASNFPLYLNGSASYWYRDLPTATAATFATLKQAFLAKYQPHEGMRWVRLSELADRKQQPTETVEAYLVDIEKLCCQLRKSQEERMEAFIRGLLPNIRAHVIKAHPKTVEEAITQARLAQSTSAPTTNPPTEVNSAIKQLADQISALQAQLSTISATQPIPARQPTRGTDARQRQPRPQRQQAFQAGQQQGQGQQQVQPPISAPAMYPCRGCGGECTIRQTCPAWGIECNFCHKFGHFARVCFLRSRSHNLNTNQ